MMLMTKAITKKAQKQFPRGSDMEQLVVAKFFDPCGSCTWYMMNQDPTDPNYLWGIVKGQELETGSFSLSELSSYKGPLGIGIERDLHFDPKPAKEIWARLGNGEHI